MQNRNRRDPGRPRGQCNENEDPQQEHHIVQEPGHQPEEQIPDKQDAGIHLRDHRVIIAVGIFQDLISQKVNGNFI